MAAIRAHQRRAKQESQSLLPLKGRNALRRLFHVHVSSPPVEAPAMRHQCDMGGPIVDQPYRTFHATGLHANYYDVLAKVLPWLSKSVRYVLHGRGWELQSLG
eukprot:3533080-Prymnesium_polylepis.1